MLGAFLIVDNGMKKNGAWAALGQSHGFMSPQHIDGFSCQIRNAPKCSLRGTFSVPQPELDQ